jgi:hypothetical protein
MVIEPHLINELWRWVCLKMEHAPKIVFQMGNIAIKHPIFLTPTVQTNLCTIVARNTGTYLLDDVRAKSG